MTLLNNGNKKQFLFDYVYHEACKNHIGILDQFNEQSGIKKTSVR